MDLDGTVLDETFQPSPRTAAAIARAEASGIACLIATGRMFVSARRVAEELGIRRPLICYQGALVGRPVTRRGARAPADRGAAGARDPARDARGARAALEPLRRRRALRLGGERGDACATRRSPASRCTSSATCATGSSGRRRRSSRSATPETMDALRDALQPRFGSRAFVAKSLPYFLEFAAPGVSKASGWRSSPSCSASRPTRRVAFGDGENDREMLDWAGCGVAVANADERLDRRGRLASSRRCTRTASRSCSRRSPLLAAAALG